MENGVLLVFSVMILTFLAYIAVVSLGVSDEEFQTKIITVMSKESDWFGIIITDENGDTYYVSCGLSSDLKLGGVYKIKCDVLPSYKVTDYSIRGVEVNDGRT